LWDRGRLEKSPGGVVGSTIQGPPKGGAAKWAATCCPRAGEGDGVKTFGEKEGAWRGKQPQGQRPRGFAGRSGRDHRGQIFRSVCWCSHVPLRDGGFDLALFIDRRHTRALRIVLINPRPQKGGAGAAGHFVDWQKNTGPGTAEDSSERAHAGMQGNKQNFVDC